MSSQTKQPRFRWQAILIITPVLLLALAALVSLRLDRAQAEKEGREHARLLAESVARTASRGLESDLDNYSKLAFEREFRRKAMFGSVQSNSPTASAGQRERFGIIINPGLAEACAQHCPGFSLGIPPQVDSTIVNGKSANPLDYAEIPEPPDWLSQFTPEVRQRWEDLQQAFHQHHNPDQIRLAIAEFLESEAPPAAKTNAAYFLLRLQATANSNPALRAEFVQFADQAKGITTETGLPLDGVAWLEALRLRPLLSMPDDWINRLARNLQASPSLLSPLLIQEMKALVSLADTNTLRQVRAHGQQLRMLEEYWQSQSQALELTRQIARQSLAGPVPSEMWLASSSGDYLALIAPASPASPSGSATNLEVQFFPGGYVESVLSNLVNDAQRDLPPFYLVELQLGDRIIPKPAKSRPDAVSTNSFPRVATAASDFISLPAPLLAQNSAAWGRPYPLLAHLSVINRESWLAGYRRRLWWYGALILGAAVTALVGLYGAWRAFQRQLHLNRMKSDFVSSVSHELRAPIAAVRLMAESLERGKIAEPKRQSEYFTLIVRECQRLSTLIANVLDFSRIDQGRKQYEFEAADVAALVDHTVQVLAPLAADRQVNLVCQLPGDASAENHFYPEVDAQALQQALVNLIDNAIKHSPAGRPVTVGLEWPAPVKPGSAAPANAKFRLWVEDQGPGIPAAELERIFDPFYRRGSELRRETQGIGIGLSIVKHIVDAHHGQVRVQSEPGRATRFVLELPMTQPSPNRDAS